MGKLEDYARIPNPSPAKMFAAFVAWKEESHNTPAAVYPCGQLLRDGPSSIALIPKDRPDCVTKIIKPGAEPFGRGVEDEFNLLDRLQKLSNEHSPFVTPRPISYGHEPDTITMERLGSVFCGHDPSAMFEAGFNVGIFNLIAHRELGLVHMDIGPGNLTIEPHGRTGVLDIASMSSGADLEDSIAQASVYPALPQGMVHGICSIAPGSLDFAHLDERCEILKRLATERNPNASQFLPTMKENRRLFRLEAQKHGM